MFVDRTQIIVKAGKGGNGCCSFRREKFVPRGGPDGGDGGNGGDVFIEASNSEQSLVSLIYQSRYQAKNGPNGRGMDQHGKNASPVIVTVPAGTVITNAETGEFIADLDVAGKRTLVAKGGRGGRGNARFATSTNRAPREYEAGTEGEEFTLDLELKTIADVGLVGFPNAGKSTLIGALTAAHPKVASYPFTTLYPVVGIVEYPDYYRLSVADIPGLIDGAHENVGLGHAFLRHIERTGVLLFVLDMAGVDGRSPVDDLFSLRKELDYYQPGLSQRPSLIIANKMDLTGAMENLKALRQAVANENITILPISAGYGELETLPAVLRDMVEKERNK